ncbi:MAG TPA: phenylalanine--tRNA ligase subunit alpha [Candidatus Paceibacterota bacterium]|jgi:phenylalanyl-tRNA synthetase alpha chain
MEGSNGGHTHLISQAISEINAIFYEMGFVTMSGPEAELEKYNFDDLNIPKDHPSRDMWDTFWLKDGRLLRTHTSPVQVRYMEKYGAPARIIVPGKTYRHEATDATHESEFYQLEGLAVDEHITLGHLKWTLETFLSKFFGRTAEIRFRPSYFPFVEPGVEVDVKYTGAGESRWLELLGAGMVHPHVLKHAGIDAKTYQGFAFGVGIERLLLARHKIDDIRRFHSGDLRFINQF